MHYELHKGAIASTVRYVAAGAALLLLALVLFPPVLLLMPFTNLAFPLILRSKSRPLLRMLGHTEPRYWFDKATIHQTQECLCQASQLSAAHAMPRHVADCGWCFIYRNG